MQQQYVVIKDGKLVGIKDSEDIKAYVYTHVNRNYEEDDAVNMLRNIGYTVVTLAQAYSGQIGKRMITNGKTKFVNIEEAVKWLIKNGHTSSIKGATTTLKRNLDKKTKTAYGMNFSYVIENDDIDLKKLFS